MIAISRMRWERPTRKEVRILIARIQAGDRAASDELVSRMNRFLSYCIWKAMGGRHKGKSPIPYYLGAAAMSLLRHAASFDLENDRAKFSTYAHKGIILAVRDQWMEDRQIVRAPRTMPTASQIDVDRAIAAKQPVVELSNHDIQSQVYTLPEHDDEFCGLPRSALPEMLSKLSQRHQEVLKMRLMDELTYEECGRALGVCKERARTIEKQAIKLLRHDANMRIGKRHCYQ